MMYADTIMHESRPVADAAEAARLIHKHEARQFDALIWKAANGRTLAVVADNHCNNPFLEVAVIDMDQCVQIESITAGWIKDSTELAEYFIKCETPDHYPMGQLRVCLPLDGGNADAKADFECGCCGTSFESTYAEQRKYDQDNGYGFCPDCARMYH